MATIRDTIALRIDDAAHVALRDGTLRDVPTSFRIFRAGWNRSTKGGFLFDQEAADSVMAEFSARTTPMTMDYEHQSIAQPPVIAEASATQIRLALRETANGPELWSEDVMWEADAFKRLQTGKYRLVSPFFKADGKTRRILQVLNVALAQLPALDDQEPLVAARADDTEDEHMDPKDTQIAELNARVAALTAETASLREKANGSELIALSTAFGVAKPADALPVAHGLVALRADVIALTGAKTSPEALGVITAWKQDASTVVALRADLAANEQKTLTADLDAVVAKAVKDGKVTTASKDTVRAMGVGADGKVSKDLLVKLTAFVGAISPAVVTEEADANGETAREGKQNFALTAVTKSQKRVNEALGVDQKEFEEWERKEREEGRWTGDLARTA